jgi:hypothetical protein
MAVTHLDPSAAFLPALAERCADDILALFAAEPVIEDPRHGSVSGRDAVREYVGAQADWMREHSVDLDPPRTTVGSGLSITEFLARLTVDGNRTELPIAVVAELAAESAGSTRGLRAIRVYHSNWPLEGRHRLRSPIVPADPHLRLPDVIAEYMDGLHTANLARSESVFERDAYFREPSGGDYVYRGSDGIRDAYGAFYKVGPIFLEHCTVIDDGVACGVEFIAVGWGPRKFEPQAGVAVYERGRSGKLAAARVYDDVDVDLGLK